MKRLIIIICLVATVIIGYQIAQALTISSGSMSISSGSLSKHYPTEYDQMWIDSEGNYFVDSEGNIFIGATP